MCGINGIAGLDRSAEHLSRMLPFIKHRGPDDSGMFLSANKQVALGHQRLAILDLSPSGHQPMHGSDGGTTIVFNGEIYNFRQLKNELQRKGVQFKSHSDTEVILALYVQHGPSCVQYLDGMFAFAIWDEKQQRLFCARDPLGIKPFYYWQNGNVLAFASEVRALLQADLAPRRLDAHALHNYLLYGSVQEPSTLVAGIRSLPAGHTLTWTTSNVAVQQYWDLKFDEASVKVGDYGQAISLTRRALDDTIERHFVSDVPVGIFLSGGIDSTAVLALAHAQQIAPLSTFCIGFEQSELDESPLAHQTATHFNTEHHHWPMTAKEGMELFHDFLGAFDLPSNDGFNTYCVSRFAHDNGLKVVLSGLGGDELFGGYPSFQTIPKLLRIHGMVKWAGGAGRLAAHSLSKLPLAPRQQRLLSYLQSQGTITDAYWTMRGHFTPLEADTLLSDFGAQQNIDCETEDELPKAIENCIAYLESTRYMRNQLLRDSDVLSMAVGLELRTPLVDRKLWDTIAGLPASARLQPGKKLLTDAVPEIPSWIVGGPKRGFRFPFEQWVSGPWSDVFASLERRVRVPLKTWSRKWSLFVLNHFITTHKIG